MISKNKINLNIYVFFTLFVHGFGYYLSIFSQVDYLYIIQILNILLRMINLVPAIIHLVLLSSVILEQVTLDCFIWFIINFRIRVRKIIGTRCRLFPNTSSTCIQVHAKIPNFFLLWLYYLSSLVLLEAHSQILSNAHLSSLIDSLKWVSFPYKIINRVITRCHTTIAHRLLNFNFDFPSHNFFYFQLFLLQFYISSIYFQLLLFFGYFFRLRFLFNRKISYFLLDLSLNILSL